MFCCYYYWKNNFQVTKIQKLFLCVEAVSEKGNITVHLTRRCKLGNSKYIIFKVSLFKISTGNFLDQLNDGFIAHN